MVTGKAMCAQIIVDLRQRSMWDPGHLTAESFRWPKTLHVAAIEHLVTRVVPRSFADVGAPVITPASVDKNTGAIRRRARNYQGAVFQVGVELRSGDVLVARTGVSAALLVTDRLLGSLVSERFTALRPQETQYSKWIWAVLTSESGCRLRSSLMSGAASPVIAPAQLLRAPIPVPALNQLMSMSDAIDSLEETTHSLEERAGETWWGTADLRTLEWRLALAIPNPGQLDEGVPLGTYCTEIARGRNTRRDSIDFEAPGYVAVADVSTLGGKSPRRWLAAEASSQIFAYPGDLLVAAVGDYAYASIVDNVVVVDQNVYRIRLLDQSLAGAIARYLNSANGFGVRRIFLSGVTVTSLSRSDLGRFPIPNEALASPVSLSDDSVPLAQRLELALWQS